MTDRMTKAAPRGREIEALYGGEWHTVEWTESAHDGSGYGCEGFAHAFKEVNP